MQEEQNSKCSTSQGYRLQQLGQWVEHRHTYNTRVDVRIFNKWENLQVVEPFGTTAAVYHILNGFLGTAGAKYWRFIVRSISHCLKQLYSVIISGIYIKVNYTFGHGLMENDTRFSITKTQYL